MRKSQEKLIRKLVSIGSKHIKIIDHFIEDGRHTSESDVIRQALIFYHDKIFPSYVFHLSPAAKMKQKEIEEIEEEANQTDEQLAAKLKFFPMEKNTGEKVYFYRGLGRTPYVIPVDSIREWAEKPINKYEIDENYIHYNEKPPKKYFSDSIGDLFRKQNDLKMPEFPEDDE
jgi:Arc/MetJ-type ribon-helix-helix transcriptional regulator